MRHCAVAVLVAAAAAALLPAVRAARPNVLFIMVDDVGAADLGFSFRLLNLNKTAADVPIRTPHLDALAGDAVRLSHYYVHTVCTPTRAALLTGRYAHSVSLQGVIVGTNPYGIDPKYKTLGESFKEADYATHMIGKWHVGFAKPSFAPLGKGFDTFLGMYNGGCGYYDKRAGPLEDLANQTSHFFTDEHATPLFTREAVRLIEQHGAAADDKPFFLFLSYNAAHTPLQPEERHRQQCLHLKFHARQDYCGLILGVDEGVGQIAEALKRTGQLDNTIIVFSSDNGGMPSVGGLNYPLRGTKNSMMDGGMRTVGFVRGPGLPAGVYDGLMHVSDWYPTLMGLVGGESKNDQFEGHDLSQALKTGGPSPRHEIELHLDDAFWHTNKTAYRDDRYKIVLGFPGDSATYYEPYDFWLNGRRIWLDFVATWLNELLNPIVGKTTMILYEVIINHLRVDVAAWLGYSYGMKEVLLFDLVEDPYENNNLAPSRPDLVAKYLARVDQMRATRAPPIDWMQIIKGPPPYRVVPEYPTRRFWYPFLAEDTNVSTLTFENVFYDFYLRQIRFYFILPLVTTLIMIVLGLRLLCRAGTPAAAVAQQRAPLKPTK